MDNIEQNPNKAAMKKLLAAGFLNALGAIIYIGLVATLMTSSNRLFMGAGPFVSSMAIICLLVLSAAIMGAIILGRPILWYFNGRKEESIKLFLYTVGWFFVFTMIIFILMATVLHREIVYY